jgi:hydrogenase maturation protease
MTGNGRSSNNLLKTEAGSGSAEAMQAPARKRLVLGLGNDILTDDAVGLRVVRRLAGELRDRSDIDVRETTEMGLALLDFLTGYASAFIVDSFQTGRLAPGSVHELDPITLNLMTGRTPHFLGVGETLTLGRELGLAMPGEVRIFAIEIEDPWTVGTTMSPALEEALPRIVARIREAVRANSSLRTRQTPPTLMS